MTLIELETEDGTEHVLDIPDSIDKLTKKKIVKALDVTTRIKNNGEAEHEIENSLETGQKVMRIVINRSLKRCEEEVNFSADDLTETSKGRIVDHFAERLEEMGMDVKKKKPG